MSSIKRPKTSVLVGLSALALPVIAFGSMTPRACDEPLMARLASLESANARLQDEVRRLRADQELLSSLRPYVSVDSSHHAIVFSGANVYVQSGSGATDDDGSPRGLGNLILGYSSSELNNYDRSGSHNLIVGDENSWRSYGSIIVGAHNTVNAPYGVVHGTLHQAAGNYAHLIGSSHHATGQYATVSGGAHNLASGAFSTMSGTFLSEASGSYSVIHGGAHSVASEPFSMVSGGTSFGSVWPTEHQSSASPCPAAQQ